MRRVNVRIVALALVLVFTQKMGLRLWMHHWLHETKALSASKHTSVDKLQPNCDCIDDFLMPLTGSAVIELLPPVCTAHPVMATAYIPPFSAAEERLSPLRGPPVHA